MEKEYQDITLICEETGKEFVWTAGEQRFYDEKGFTNKPKYCPEVRAAKKAARNKVSDKEFKDITLICEETGKEFVWTAGEQKFYAEKGFTNKPKYCPEVRAAKKAARDAKRDEE